MHVICNLLSRLKPCLYPELEVELIIHSFDHAKVSFPYLVPLKQTLRSLSFLCLFLSPGEANVMLPFLELAGEQEMDPTLTMREGNHFHVI